MNTPAHKTVKPERVEELAQIITEAADQKKSVLALGGGTHIFTAGKEFDIAVDLTGLTEGFLHTSEDMTATVPAGIRFSEAQKELSQNGQWIPLDPPDRGNSTVGGVISADRWGPRRHRYGSARDWVIATTVINDKGEIVRAGANVVKNVSGYDLNKVYIGARGTLGILTDISFKLSPLPSVRTTFRACFSTIEEAFENATAIHGAPLEPEALLITKGRWTASRAKHWWLLIELAGSEESVEVQAQTLSMLLQESKANRWNEAGDEDAAFYWETAGFGNDEAPPLFAKAEISHSKSRAESLVSHLNEHHPEISVKLLPSKGVTIVEVREDMDRSLLIKETVKIGGEIEFEGDGITSPLERWPIEVVAMPLMKKLKTALDPSNIFAPGTFVGGI
ncbi:MAG: FAD-binding oxidoreductase [Candidatus Neomarinimicrobiota bacterium]|nr:FAD-binding oxidoreductase [Candidatus Neomarinimicrobiota bacterium]